MTSSARLFIGGTSGLARTYFHQYPQESWIVVGREASSPAWLDISKHTFLSIDLTLWSQTDNNVRVPNNLTNLETIVIGLRPPLVTLKSHAETLVYNERLVTGLGHFLRWILSQNQTSVKVLLHVSSVAAVGHIETQVNWNESHQESTTHLTYPYDIFKRDCEILVEKVSNEFSIQRFTNLRISAIFADSEICIQCGALQIQQYLSCYLPLAIDCNSARNVTSCMAAILQSTKTLASVYYYTRCTIQPVAYGSYLQEYQRANNISWSLWIPVTAVIMFVRVFHILASALPFLQSLDYLLQVASYEHSFDNSLVRSEFDFQEETIYECFCRRRRYLEQSMSVTHSL